MPSSPLDSTNSRTTSGVVCHHHLWVAHTAERRWAWHAIIAFGLADTIGRCQAWKAIIALGRQTRSNDIGRGMPSPHLNNTHGQTMSGLACNHRLWAAQTVGRCQMLHAISPLACTHSRTTLGVACHHCLSAAHTVERRRAWHAIIAFGQHTRSNDVGRVMPSSLLD